MNRRGFLKACGLGAAAAAVAAGSGCRLRAGQPRRGPNIVFILADDLGWMDSTVYGSRYYETPNLERLAGRGMMFTDAYAANPLCSPTRASIMTGKYPARLGITTPAGHLPAVPDEPIMADRGPPGQKMICPRSRRFLPPDEYTLGEALRDAGYRTGFFGKWHLGLAPEHWPEQQGFEVVFHGAPDPGPPSYFSPYRFRTGTVTDGPAGEYITDRVTDEALRFINASRDRPFLVCLWHWAVHAPFQAKADLADRYRGRTDPRGKQACPVMAGMIQSLDESVGRVLDALDAAGIADDTVILFFSDNGGNMYNTVEGTTPTSNAPLRSGKGSLYEGGVREPMIVVWPGVVKPGARSAEVVSSVDFYPTLLAMAGARATAGHLIDGTSLVPHLRDGAPLGREAVFCHFPHYVPATGNLPGTSVRAGRWKLIRFYGEGPGRSDAWELYDLANDIGEARNLADAMPDKVRELDALIDRFLADTGAIVPKANPAYTPGVQGWAPSKDCRLAAADGALVVESSGSDPSLHTADVPRVEGRLTLRLRMRSRAAGGGQVFWTTMAEKRFHRDRSAAFRPVHDGLWHEYDAALEAGAPLWGIRLDPATAPGRIDVDWVRLLDPDGAVRKEWDFGGPAGP